MRAHKWRKALIGAPETIRLLRQTNIPKTIDSEYRRVINDDLRRTFPENNWFTNHISELSNILNLYAYTNNGMGYAQGMAFIVFILYKIYYEDEPKYASQDTYYSFHKLITIIRPIYPLHDKDVRPNLFKDDIKRIVYLKIAHDHRDLAEKLKYHPDILPVLIYQCIPTLFGNKFAFKSSCLLFDFMIVSKPVELFNRVLCVLCGIIISLKEIFMSMSFEKILQLISAKELYNVRKIICIANKIK